MKSSSLVNSNKPDFIIIGAQKGGTSSLFYYLSQHPQLRLPEVKEVHFFDNNYDKGIKWYQEQFPDISENMAKTGEASPYYIFHPHVPGRVFACCSAIKLIVMLRNPVDRAYSHFMMQKNRGIEPLTFEEAMEAESERIADEEKKIINNTNYKSLTHQQRSYIARGKYYSQLKQWLEYFSLDQFLFIKSESFFNDPLKELSRVYSFLNIKYTEDIEFTPQNTNEYQQMKPKTRALLDNYYATEIINLYHLTGINFHWND